MNVRHIGYHAALVAILMAPLSAYSYLCSSFDAKTLSERAIVVCKVQVLSVAEEGVYTDEHFHPPLKTVRMVAHVKCLTSLKGAPPATLSIAFPECTATVGYTELSTGEVCIVFLDSTNDTARFVDVHNGKMACSDMVVPYDMGDRPEDRMLCELLALCKSSTGTTQLLATEYLGQLGDARARALLEEESRSKDPALGGVALASLIVVGVAPPAEQILSYLDRDPTTLDYGASLAKYRTSAYTIQAIAGQIVRGIESSIKVKDWHRDMVMSRPTTQLPDFDYVAFFDKAMVTRLVQADPMMRRSMAEALRHLADERSVPLLRTLLEDSSADVRYYTVTALTRIHRGGPFPSAPLFKTNETAYVGYWKDKLK